MGNGLEIPSYGGEREREKERESCLCFVRLLSFQKITPLQNITVVLRYPIICASV